MTVGSLQLWLRSVVKIVFASLVALGPTTVFAQTEELHYPYFYFGKAFPIALGQMPKEEIMAFVKPYPSFRKGAFKGNSVPWPREVKTAQLDYKTLLISMSSGPSRESGMAYTIQEFLESWLRNSALTTVAGNADILVSARLAGWHQFEAMLVPEKDIVAVLDLAIKANNNATLLRVYHIEIPMDTSYFVGDHRLVNSWRVRETFEQQLPSDLRKSTQAPISKSARPGKAKDTKR